MKKLLIILLAISVAVTNSCFATTSTETINISAFVGNVNQAAVITLTPSQLNDSGNVEVLDSTTGYFDVSIAISDNENDNINYTITPSAGTVTSLNGGPLDTPRTVANGKSIDFTYNAPASPPSDQDTNTPTITITVNDGSSVTTSIIYVYIL